MKTAIWFFFHKLRVIFVTAYHIGKVIQQAKDRVAYVQIRAITHEQMDKLQNDIQRPAEIEDLHGIVDEHVLEKRMD